MPTITEEGKRALERTLYTGVKSVFNVNESVTRQLTLIPNYRSRIKAGIPTSGFYSRDHIKVTYAKPGIFVTEQKYAGNTEVRTSVGHFFYSNTIANPSTDPTGAQLNAALSAWIGAAYNALVSFESGTFMGELASAVRMIRRPASSLRDSISAYTKRAEKRAMAEIYKSRRGLPIRSRRQVVSNVNKAIQGTYLEATFGWQPLISDIDNAAKALASLTTGVRPAQQRISRSSSTDRTIDNGPLGPFNVGWGSVRGKSTTVIRSSVKYHGAVKIDVPAASYRDTGGSVTSFLPTIWNLIPYSFVVDYFSNVGSLLQAISLPSGSVAWLQHTVRATAEKRHFYDGLTLNADTTTRKHKSIIEDPSELWVQRMSLQRFSDGTDVPVPSLQFQVPGSNVKFLNVASLVLASRAASGRISRALP